MNFADSSQIVYYVMNFADLSHFTEQKQYQSQAIEVNLGGA